MNRLYGLKSECSGMNKVSLLGDCHICLISTGTSNEPRKKNDER